MALISQHIANAQRRYGRGGMRGTNRYGQIPAPVRGLNSRDAIAKMKPAYALRLRNFFPEQGSVGIRRGYVEAVKGVSTGVVETLFEFVSDDTRKLFAAAGGNIYDATPMHSSSGAVVVQTLTGTPFATGYNKNRWNAVNMNRAAIWVNGEDTPFQINAMGAMAPHGLTSTETGFDADKLFAVHVFKNRLFLLEKDSPRVFYGPVDAIQGALSAFDLSLVSNTGGNVLAVGSLTMDSGVGIDDRIVFFMSTGSMLMYAGTDPSTATGWSLIGEYQVGNVIGENPLVQLGGDLIAICDNGFTSVADLLTPGRRAKFLRLSDEIQSLVTADARRYGDNAGWQAVLHPSANWFLFNVPETSTISHQYVQNSQTGAWADFGELPAACWAAFGDHIYFGTGGGVIHQADTGYTDDGDSILAELITAYSAFRTNDAKHLHGVRAHLTAALGANVETVVLVDYERALTGTVPLNIASTGGAWGGAWGQDWAPSEINQSEWRGAREYGRSLAFGLRVRTRGAAVTFHGADIAYEPQYGLV